MDFVDDDGGGLLYSEQPLFGHRDTIIDVQSSGNFFVSIDPKLCLLWTINPQAIRHEMPVPADVLNVSNGKSGEWTCVDMKDTLLVLGTSSGHLFFYYSFNGKVRHRLEYSDRAKFGCNGRAISAAGEERVYCVKILPGSKSESSRVVSGIGTGEVRVWNGDTGELMWILAGHRTPLMLIAANEEFFATSCQSPDHAIRVWKEQGLSLFSDLEPDKANAVLVGCNSQVTAMTFHGEVLISGTSDGTVTIWSPMFGIAVQQLVGHTAALTGIIAVGHLLATASKDSSIRLWSLVTGTDTAVLAGHHFAVTGLQYIDHMGVLVSIGDDGQLIIWNPNYGNREGMLHIGGGRLREPLLRLWKIDDKKLLTLSKSRFALLDFDPEATQKSIKQSNRQRVEKRLEIQLSQSSPEIHNAAAYALPWDSHVSQLSTKSMTSPLQKANSNDNLRLLGTRHHILAAELRSSLIAAAMPTLIPNKTSKRVRCSTCGKKETVVKQFRICSGCRLAFYCCQLCQEKDWKEGRHAERCSK